MTNAHQPAATLTVSLGPGAGSRFDIGAAPATIGRGAVNDIQIEGTWVSRRHARIAWSGTEYVLEDLGSTNGTFVNGERVRGPHALNSGDRLQLGTKVELGFEMYVPDPHYAQPVAPGIAPSPASSAGPPPAYAPPSEPIPAQKEPFLRRKSTRIGALALAGVLLVVIIGVSAYYLLSDDGQQVADLPAEQPTLPQPSPTLTAIPPTPTPTSTPTPTPTPVPPTATPTPVPPTATPKPEPLVIKGDAFEADSQSACPNVDVAITDVVGDGLRIQVLSGSIAIRAGGLTIWCYGAKHTWMGKLTYGGYTFDSDENSPLQFTLDSRKGYIYLSGKGNVTQPDGKIVELP